MGALVLAKFGGPTILSKTPQGGPQVARFGENVAEAARQRGLAQGYASAANDSAVGAVASASAADASKIAAQSAQTAAEAARDATLAAYDSFDDRYLGAKTSNPTVDNDGNALVAGTLYYNTTVPEMRLYTGSAWVAAYVSGGSFVSLSGGTMTGLLILPASASGTVPLRIPHGADPSSATNGDVWSKTTGWFVRTNGVTEQLAMIAATQTLTNKSVALGSNTVTGTLAQFNTACTDADFASISGIEALSNKDIVPRASTTANVTTTWEWNSDSYDGLAITAQAGNLTISADAGTPVNFRKRVLRITASAADRTITFTGATSKGFVSCAGTALTVSGSNWTLVVASGKTVEIGLIYDSNAARWRIDAITTD